MAVAHDHHPTMPRQERNRCALMFALTWIGFFAAIGAVAWLMSAF